MTARRPPCQRAGLETDSAPGGSPPCVSCSQVRRGRARCRRPAGWRPRGKLLGNPLVPSPALSSSGSAASALRVQWSPVPSPPPLLRSRVFLFFSRRRGLSLRRAPISPSLGQSRQKSSLARLPAEPAASSALLFLFILVPTVSPPLRVICIFLHTCSPPSPHHLGCQEASSASLPFLPPGQYLPLFLFLFACY